MTTAPHTNGVAAQTALVGGAKSRALLLAEEEAFGGGEPAPPTPPKKQFYRCPELVEAILRQAELPWIGLRVTDESEPVIRVRVGSYVVLIGSEGSGKSSLLLQVGAVFARSAGVFIYFTVELDEEEAAGRLVGQYANESWENALRGLPLDTMKAALDLPRFNIIAGENATLAILEKTVEQLRRELPGMPIVVGVDYIQAIESKANDERARVSRISKDLRLAAKRLRVVLVAISQTSRANRKGLRDGETVGADTVTTGAESSQIERDAYVTLALGGLKPQPDGTTAIDLSIGKTRMGVGDRVIPLVLDGRSGRFWIAGESRSGVEVRAEREATRSSGRVHAAELAIAAHLATSAVAMTREEVREALGLRKADVSEAVRALLRRLESNVVQVRIEDPKRRGRNGALRLWVRDRAVGAGLDIVPTGFGGCHA